MKIKETLEITNRIRKENSFNQPGFNFSVDGRKFYVGFRGSNGDYYMSFTGQDNLGRQSAKLLNHNKPFSVFSGVLSCIIYFIKERNPTLIEFMVDKTEQERVRIYDQMLDAADKRKLFPENYTWDRDGNNNYYIFLKGSR